MTAPMTTPSNTGPFASHMQQMMQTHPHPQTQFDAQALVACIQACFDCGQTCTACADACLSESMVQELTHCIRLNLDCADICTTTGRILARQTKPELEVIRAQLQSCLQACKACGSECRRHAHHHQHCAVCAEACQRCEDACNRLLGMAA